MVTVFEVQGCYKLKQWYLKQFTYDPDTVWCNRAIRFHASESRKYFWYLRLFWQFSHKNFIGRKDAWKSFSICITYHFWENHDESGHFRPFLELYMPPVRPCDLWTVHNTDNILVSLYSLQCSLQYGVCLDSEIHIFTFIYSTFCLFVDILFVTIYSSNMSNF